MSGELRILIAEDYEGCRELYSLWLGEEHDVSTVENGTRALKEVDRHVDLVLIDHDMPGPTGTDVAREMRDCGYDDGIILVTSQPMEFDLSTSPFDDYVQKPASREALETAVMRFAKRKQLQAALDDYYALTATKAKLKAAISESDLRNHEYYLELRTRVERKRDEVNEILTDSIDDWRCAFAALHEMTDPERPDAPSECPPIPQQSSL